MFKKTVLDNGIKILTEEMKEFKSASIGIWVHAGPQNEIPGKNNGISHFIEHMMFKGTKTRSARKIAEIMDSVGGQLNAFTEKEQTCFYNRVIDEHLPLAMEVLADMFNNSLFNPIEIERERKVILEEINMYEDDPDDLIFEEFNKTLWGEHPLSIPILGKKENVKSFTRQDFINFINDFYTPDQITISAAGHLIHDQIVDMSNKYFGNLKGKSKKTPIEPPKFHTRKSIRYKDVEQAYYTMGGRGVSQRDSRKYVFFVLDSILGGSMSSRLFQEIREKRGLVYTVGTFTNPYCDVAQFGIYACTSPDNLEEVINVSNDIIDDVRKNGVTQKEIERAKEHIKGGVSLGLESTSNRMIRLSKSELYHNRLIPIEEVFEKVDKVQREDVNELAKWLLERKNFSTAILGPIKKTAKENVRS